MVYSDANEVIFRCNLYASDWCFIVSLHSIFLFIIAYVHSDIQSDFLCYFLQINYVLFASERKFEHCYELQIAEILIYLGGDVTLQHLAFSDHKRFKEMRAHSK